MADKTLLILEKLPALSHLKERKEKNCLNCNAQVHGKYCHICGQENIEPAESAWHLVTHFFNDITHFDGKFFSTLKLLITKPGFLSAEYKRGRRANYLNPVRMYIFTSFIFFIILFSVFKIGEKDITGTSARTAVPDAVVEAMDSTEFANFTKGINRGKVLTREEYNSWKNKSSITIVGNAYRDKKEYDSLVKAGKVKEGWFMRKLTQKNFAINEKYKDNKDKAITSILDKFIHYFPQILFISLPFFALFLTLIYYRHKDYFFVSHGIYSVHLYIYYFIVLLLMVGVDELREKIGGNWPVWANFVLTLALLIYEYKAMRYFYGQGRFKTIIKYILVLLYRLFIILLLFIVFFFFVFLNI